MGHICIKEARYVSDFRIWIRFNTGESGEVDLEPMIFKYDAARTLQNSRDFSQFYLDGWPTLAWSCGFDVSPEYLYELVTGKAILRDTSETILTGKVLMARGDQPT